MELFERVALKSYQGLLLNNTIYIAFVIILHLRNNYISVIS